MSPILGFDEQDVAFVKNQDRALYNEAYPAYSYEELDEANVAEDELFGDLENKVWKTATTFPMMIRHVETEGQEEDTELSKDKLDIEIQFSTAILEDKSVTPKPGDLITYGDFKYEIMFIRLTDPLGSSGEFLHRLARARRYDEKRVYPQTAATAPSTTTVAVEIGPGI